MNDIKKIMLVDDDEDITVALKTLLEKSKKFKVFFTNDGSEAFNLAQREQPDLIICDIDMPKVTGDDVAYALSESDKTKDIPLLFFSSLLREEESGETGVSSDGRPIISKSASIITLIDKIEAMLGM
ncbi:MAG: response regulator [Desulfobacterales bacterium]|nr:response regulator [Desulfobacterales bacterium]